MGSTWTVPLSNRFEVLSEDVEIGAVEVGMNLKEAGRGKDHYRLRGCGVRAAQEYAAE